MVRSIQLRKTLGSCVGSLTECVYLHSFDKTHVTLSNETMNYTVYLSTKEAASSGTSLSRTEAGLSSNPCVIDVRREDLAIFQLFLFYFSQFWLNQFLI